MDKFITIGLMALLFSGIIFSFIFLYLLRDKAEKNRAKKISISNELLEEFDKFFMYGNYWITIESWFGLQILFLLVVVVAGFYSYGLVEKVRNMFVLWIGLQSIVLVVGVLEIKMRNIVINLDLCRLQESLYFQSDTGVEREVILNALYEKVNDPMLQKVIKEIIFAYSLKQDVIEKIEGLKRISNNMNLIVFANILIQDFDVGEIDRNIEAQATVTRRLISNRAIIERKTMRVKMSIVGIVLGFLLMFLLVTPTIIEFTEEFNKILS